MLEQEYRSEIFIHKKQLKGNIDLIRKRVGNEAGMMAVIKDNAYGHGIIQSAEFLKDYCDWFCVSEIEEALSIRKAGIELPILVFEVPRKPTLSLYRDYNITATVSDLQLLKDLPSDIGFHLMFDTGMHRLGILPEQVSEVQLLLTGEKANQCGGIFTHFSDAEEVNHPKVEKQLKLFRQIRPRFPDHLLTHMANSGSIMNYGREIVFDAVRPGGILFGYSAKPFQYEGLFPALEWKSFLMQVRPVKKGEYVGYSSGWQVEEDGYIGTIPVGYADGIPRSIKHKLSFLINGRPYRQVGNITMDYSMVFSPKNDLKTGDEVTLMDLNMPNANHWSEACSTIPYEVTTAISEHIPRKLV
jgi:alanine racemase